MFKCPLVPKATATATAAAPAQDGVAKVSDPAVPAPDGRLYDSLHRKGVYPPINPLPSLSRLMNDGIGKGRTREDHSNVKDQLLASYANGVDLRRLVAIIGEAALSEEDRQRLAFAERFEQEFISQEQTNRPIEETFAIA